MTLDLIGRDSELAALGDWLDDPWGRLAVVEGEPGIGKTSVWRHACSLAAERGIAVVISSPAESDQQLVFAGLADLLSPLLPQTLAGLAPVRRRAIEAALLLGDGDDQPLDERAVAFAVLDVLRSAAREQPLVLAIDDAQWLDRSTATVIAFALRRLTPADRVAGIIARRTGVEDHTSRMLVEAVDADRRSVVGIGPMSLGALHRIIAARLGHALVRPILIRVHRVSGGNPFFAIELAQVAERRGSPTEALELPLPASLAETLRERLDAMPPATLDALLLVSCSVTPTLTLLETALGSPAGPVVQPAIDAGLLTADHDCLHFSHPLIGAAVTAAATPERRRECHGALASLVANVDEQAHHLSLGIDGTDTIVAQALEDAARRARLRGALDAAATLVDRSWTATPTDERDAAWRRGVLATEYHLQSGNMARFRDLSLQLLATARTGDERSLACQLLSLAIEEPETEEEWLERALAAAEGTHQRQSVESDFVTVATVGGDLASGLRHARASLRLAEELGDQSTLADARSAVARLEQILGGGLRRDLIAQIDQHCSLQETDRLEKTVGLIRTTIASSSLLATADEFANARQRSIALQDVLEQQELIQPLPEVLRFRAELECLAGDWNLAGELAILGDELAEQTGRNAIRVDLLYPRAFIAAHRGDHELAQRLAIEGVDAAERASNHRSLLRQLAVLGFVSLSEGDYPAALTRLERAAAIACDAGFVEPNWLRFHDDLGWALVGVGRLDEASDLVAWLDKRGAATSYPWTLAVAARCRGQQLAARRELGAAVDAFNVALTQGEILGNPFELARTHLELGRTHRLARQRMIARTHITHARDVFARMGAARWTEIAEDELRRISGRRTGNPGQLTEAEHRIAELVAAGQSNKEVAAALHLSVKTVEVTLTRVYRKIGVTSRSALAATFDRLKQ